MKIDSHQHFWQFNEKDYGWISAEQSIIRRDFLPNDLKPLLKESDLDGCVAVQARQSIEETNWLLELASKNDFIKGVVGWIDLKSGSLLQELELYKNEQKLKGFRHVLQDEPDANFMLADDFLSGLRQLAANNYCYDLLVFSHQLPQCVTLVEQLSELKIVVDHIAKPEIAAGTNFEQWAGYMQSLAKFDNVYCKVSGMVTEADVNSWQSADFVKYLKVVFSAFGPDRIMYGSDWPVCLLGGKYPEIKAIVSEFVAEYYPGTEQKIFGDNAVTFYQL